MPATTFSDAAPLHAAVLGWFALNGRPLNFRGRRDPYAVLVSETMAQQTQVSRVEPAWAAFLERFPSVAALAAAPVADVLRAWAGMGYNRRALNLQRAARMIVEEFGGAVPEALADLERLPGVGPYTSRAVAAIAFGQPAGAVDTNVRRVLGRVVGGPDGLPGKELQAVADGLVPAGRAGEWTHALMDIGARFCRPRAPVCDECPARPWCATAAGAGPAGMTRTRSAAAALPTPFRATTRWLRGRLVDRARAAEGDNWVRLDDPLAPLVPHDAEAIAAAVLALATEGMLELHPTDPSRARLPR